MGDEILQPAQHALRLLRPALKQASRNQDNVEQLIFAAENYRAMADKLIVTGHWRKEGYSRKKVAEELRGVVKTYEALRTEFSRLWLAEDRKNDGYETLINRFNNTIVPCRRKAEELSNARGQP
jgi:hypothetical protein